MSKAYMLTQPTDLGWGVCEAVVLCDTHAVRLTYTLEDGREMSTRRCYVCRTMTWEDLHHAHMIIRADTRVRAFEPIDVPDFTIAMPAPKRRRRTVHN